MNKWLCYECPFNLPQSALLTIFLGKNTPIIKNFTESIEIIKYMSVIHILLLFILSFQYSSALLNQSALLTSHFQKYTDCTLKNEDKDDFGIQFFGEGSGVGRLNFQMNYLALVSEVLCFCIRLRKIGCPFNLHTPVWIKQSMNIKFNEHLFTTYV